ncbi:gliding motility-associated C-terminal domain-containing protein [Arcicella aquatica]|uniref:Gliding motility-associated C-terminal domain-containing protein n=1 Tax=Arcicella aquatica TaxID=217141 RepID=A0ABU5QGV8_9BACT|nr:gliding motility-associated C-terminal domain-containing protein [Arcicella aquatica]MEA5256275.1 gliding motility-associated C-terminal domain-containing protein [Arcicella aquatica]
MQKLLFISIFFVLSTVYSFAQTDCTNIGFELGNISGWTVTSGTVTDNGTKTEFGPEQSGGIYKITNSSSGFDPKITNERIPMVAPGSNYSIQLGNTTETTPGGVYHRLRTSFMVTQDNTLFQYKFAVILQNDNNNHTDAQKPAFNINITDENGNPLTCSNFNIQLSRSGTASNFSVQNYTSGGNIEYRSWTVGSINLLNYIGKRINIEVTAHGCTKQKHFGYAYFDAQCLKSEVKPIAACPDADGSMTLSAPDGFEKYTWSNGETTPSIKVLAKLGDKYSVKILPQSSLDPSCELNLDYTIKYQHPYNTITAKICEGEKYTLGTKDYKTSGTFIENIQRTNICDSTVTLNLTVNPLLKKYQDIVICAGTTLKVGPEVYNATGVYTTTIKNAGQCDSIVTTNLKVIDFDVTLQNKDFNILSGDKVLLKAIVSTTGNYSYLWQPATDLSCANCAETWASPTSTRQYSVYVSSLDGKACEKIKVANISVRSCGLVFLPDAFSPNNDGNNDIFYAFASGCVKQIKNMKVFDRWGEVIFWKENIVPSQASYGWDGTHNGLPSDAGIYAYEVEVELNDGTTYNSQGSITLLR